MNIGHAILFVTYAVFCAVSGEQKLKCINLPKPAFLSKVDETAREQFFAIFGNPNLTSGQKKVQVIEFAKKHGFEEEGKKHVKRIEALKKQYQLDILARPLPEIVDIFYGGKLCLPLPPPPTPKFSKRTNGTARKDIIVILNNPVLGKKRNAEIVARTEEYGRPTVGYAESFGAMKQVGEKLFGKTIRPEIRKAFMKLFGKTVRPVNVAELSKKLIGKY